jgi:hypothetical protein
VRKYLCGENNIQLKIKIKMSQGVISVNNFTRSLNYWLICMGSPMKLNLNRSVQYGSRRRVLKVG